jgi:hypothetical protein
MHKALGSIPSGRGREEERNSVELFTCITTNFLSSCIYYLFISIPFVCMCIYTYVYIHIYKSYITFIEAG